jgi:hypothetical protein
MLPTDADLAALAVDSYRLAPAGEVYDSGADRAVITRRADCAIITVRGTANPAGWWSDFQIVPAVPRTHPILGPCEAGFLGGVEALYPVLRPHLGTRPVVVQGHSRGAAMAPILAAFLAIDGFVPVYCLCWEAPWAVGLTCGTFLGRQPVPGRQYINGNDPVPNVPAVWWLIAAVWPIVRIGSPMADPFQCHDIALIAAEVAALERAS